MSKQRMTTQGNTDTLRITMRPRQWPLGPYVKEMQRDATRQTSHSSTRLQALGHEWRLVGNFAQHSVGKPTTSCNSSRWFI